MTAMLSEARVCANIAQARALAGRLAAVVRAGMIKDNLDVATTLTALGILVSEAFLAFPEEMRAGLVRDWTDSLTRELFPRPKTVN